MYELNKDYHRRDEIVGLKNKKYVAGIKRFQGLSFDQLDSLVEENFISLEDKPTFAPNAQEIYDFLKDNPDFTVMGYLVSPDREDYRISLDGVELKRKPTVDEIIEFVALFRLASDFKCNLKTCYAIFDSSIVPSNTNLYKKQKAS